MQYVMFNIKITFYTIHFRTTNSNNTDSPIFDELYIYIYIYMGCYHLQSPMHVFRIVCWQYMNLNGNSMMIGVSKTCIATIWRAHLRAWLHQASLNHNYTVVTCCIVFHCNQSIFSMLYVYHLLKFESVVPNSQTKWMFRISIQVPP